MWSLHHAFYVKPSIMFSTRHQHQSFSCGTCTSAFYVAPTPTPMLFMWHLGFIISILLWWANLLKYSSAPHITDRCHLLWRTEAMLEEENSAHVDGLSSKISRLKGLALDIESDTKDSNRYLDGMGG
ncbi:uncharacterized protein LOC106876735 isoform X2 [Octopus bimaculoides]|uniref:uncharacterized protein LOC106876735 isoform X2 n=1 Tax=Octopus bimaculoides TaxID=37653 RepID=UPI0022E108B6|nr:uncharacterized protein LOC106876735 isoform X2 [Octopus bimaculoides]